MWNPKKIRKHVNDIIQENYPKDENSILSTKMNFNYIEKNFCPTKLEYYDEYKDKYEKIICFTTNFQLNILKEVNIGYSEQHDLFIPIITSLLTSKKEKIYNYTLMNILLYFGNDSKLLFLNISFLYIYNL